MSKIVKLVLIMASVYQCQSFCGEDDHYTKVPKVTVANSTHLHVSWLHLFKGCFGSDVMYMYVHVERSAHWASEALSFSLNFDEKEGLIPLDPCLEY